MAETVVEGTDFGVAQTRSRHFLVASKYSSLDLDVIIDQLRLPTLSFDDVNTDLPKIPDYPNILETQGQLSEKIKAELNTYMKRKAMI